MYLLETVQRQSLCLSQLTSLAKRSAFVCGFHNSRALRLYKQQIDLFLLTTLDHFVRESQSGSISIVDRHFDCNFAFRYSSDCL